MQPRELTDRAVGEAKYILLRLGRLELLDRTFAVSAQMFVALLPLTLLLAHLFTHSATSNFLAEQMIERFGLVGTAALAVRSLLDGTTGAIYWSAVLTVLYACMSMSRRVMRTYNAIWRSPQPGLRDQWRGMAWVLVQVAAVFVMILLRQLIREAPTWLLTLLAAGLALTFMFFLELLCQKLLTCGKVETRRLRLAAGLVTVGRAAVVAYVSVLLPESLQMKAELYGGIGIVFSVFSNIFASVAAVFGATLIASCLTDTDRDPEGSEQPGSQTGQSQTNW